MDVIDRPVTLELSRRFAAAPERVFDAWLGKAWGEWLGPAGCACEVVRMDAQVGGTYLLRMTMPDGREMETTGTYQEIDRPHLLVLTFGGCFNARRDAANRHVPPDGYGTLMTLHQQGFQDEMSRRLQRRLGRPRRLVRQTGDVSGLIRMFAAPAVTMLGRPGQQRPVRKKSSLIAGRAVQTRTAKV